MEFFELVERRHSVRSFTGEPVEQAAITRKYLKAALSAPSAKNTRSSSFMVVRGAGLIGRIARMRDYGSGVRGEGPARNTCDGRPGTERPVGGECRHIGYLCTARCAGIGTGQLLGTCRRTAATQRGARRPRRRGLSAFVPAGTGGQAYSVCSGDRAYGRTGPYPKGGDTRRGMTGSSSCRETFLVGSGVGTFRRRTFSRNAAESFPSLDIMDYGE